MKLTEQERVAACIFLGLAALTYRGEPHQPYWYMWTTQRYARETHPFARSLWWAIRFADEEHEIAEDWLAYVEYVRGNHTRQGRA